MSDLITPVIFVVFGAAMILVVLGFFLTRERETRSRFEARDYYETYKRKAPTYSGGGYPFRETAVTQQARNDQRTMVLIVVGTVVLAVAIAIIFGPFDGLLVFFLIPVIVGFVRTRRETSSRRNAAQDGNQPSY
jgi:Flp pilus assembly protein TadB